MSFIRKNYDREYYESVFYKAQNDSQRNRKRLAQVLRHKRGGTLFEIGCGPGTFLRMADKHFRVEGIDQSNYAIRNNQMDGEAELIVGDIEEAALGTEDYDVVVAFNVLEHLRHPSDCIQKIFASLRPGGLFLGSVPNNHGVVGVPHALITDLIDRTHVSNLKPSKWLKMMKNSGFRPIEFFGEMMLGRNHCIYLKKPIWKQVAFNLMFKCFKPKPAG